jgi:hypothetical protein
MNMNTNTRVIQDQSQQTPLGGLTEEQKNLLDDWLFLKKLGPDEVVVKLRDELGIKAGESDVIAYQRIEGQKRNLNKIAEANRNVHQCLKFLTDDPGEFFAQFLQEIAHQAFEATFIEDNAKRLNALLNLSRLKLHVRHEEVYERRHLLDREKWEPCPILFGWNGRLAGHIHCSERRQLRRPCRAAFNRPERPQCESLG